MSDRDTFSRVTVEFLLADLVRWLIERIEAVPTDRGAKPPDVFYDRGRLSELRAIRELVLSTKNEPNI